MVYVGRREAIRHSASEPSAQPANQPLSQPMSNSTSKLHYRFTYCRTGTATTPQLQLLHHRECDCTVNTYTSQHFHVHCFPGSRKSFAILVSLYLFICMGLVCLYCLVLCVLMDSVPSGMSEDSCCDSDEGNCMARGWMVRVCVLISWSCFVYMHGCVSWRRSHATLCCCGAMVLPWLAGVIIWDSVISQTWQKV